jgi:SAM-dependent methyltransferase
VTATALEAEARKILQAMAGDVSLVPENLAEWWSNYLRDHHDRYLGTLAFLDQGDRDILEIGSVPGQFTLLLKELGYNVRGMDLAPERVGDFLAKHGLEVDKVDIETDPFPFPDASFGNVLFMDVLEHLRINPLHTFRELARVLKPGGRMLLSTPNISPAHRLAFMMGVDYQGNAVAEFRKLETIGHMGHFRLYSVGDIRGFLDEVGLEMLSQSFEGNYLRDTWKHKLLWLVHPRKSHFRTYTYVVGRKPD